MITGFRILKRKLPPDPKNLAAVRYAQILQMRLMVHQAAAPSNPGEPAPLQRVEVWADVPVETEMTAEEHQAMRELQQKQAQPAPAQGPTP